MLTKLTTVFGVVLLASVGFAVAQSAEITNVGDTVQLAILGIGVGSLLMINRRRTIG